MHVAKSIYEPVKLSICLHPYLVPVSLTMVEISYMQQFFSHTYQNLLFVFPLLDALSLKMLFWFKYRWLECHQIHLTAIGLLEQWRESCKGLALTRWMCMCMRCLWRMQTLCKSHIYTLNRLWYVAILAFMTCSLMQWTLPSMQNCSQATRGNCHSGHPRHCCRANQ